MRQVPRYLLIGNGRVSRHIQHYFSLLELPFQTWHRQQSVPELTEKAKLASHILLLIPDDVIESFNQEYLTNEVAIRIHFSGSLISDKIYGAHPLMTFNNSVYTLADYQNIPFIIDHDAPDFSTLLPGLSNRHARLHKLNKAKYHALCVLSGNFSCLLWQKLFGSLEQEFNIPADMAFHYLKQQTDNLCQEAGSALTGPLVRNDFKTIEKNITALETDPYQEIYKNFVRVYSQTRELT